MTTNKTPISTEDAEALGVTTHHERMENGELRFRLMASDGSGYIRTSASRSGGWQNSHYHAGVLETYLVQEGWIALVELVEHVLEWHYLRPGGVYTTRPRVPHNVFLSGATVIHTVKHGLTAHGADWHAAPELDALTQSLPEGAILAACRL